MSLELISKLEIEINKLRLDLIRISAEINRVLAAQKKATRSDEYLKLKTSYQNTKEEIHYLRGLIRELSPGSQAA
jgi:predicted  nucleic acid-binding Zn-ribbon protein